MATTIKARFPLLLLLGIVFLASVSVYGIAYSGQENPCHGKCLLSCNGERNPSRRHACESRCEEWAQERCERQEEERSHREERGREEPQRERGRQEGEKEEEGRQPGRHRHQDPEERERVREREDGRRERRPRHEREEREESESRRPREREEEEEEEEERERRPRREREEKRGSQSRRGHGREEERGSESRRRHQREEEEGSSESSRPRNPFYFKSDRFQTGFENENGNVRVLQRFDRRSQILENLQNYRLLEYKSKPRTLILPHHSDADSIIVVLSGKASLTLVNSDDRDSFNLERGDALSIPAGTLAYLANRDDNENLRVVKLLAPVNRPGQLLHFFPASSGQNQQQSYFEGFSRNFLEASFDAEYNEIERILLGGGQQQESQEEGLIVKLSREDIQELSRHAKSSSRKSVSSKSQPFNLRSRDPIYSNKYGKFYEITPEKSPQLRDLDVFLSCVEINEGGLLLPHYNSRAIVVLVVNEGKGQLELVGPRQQQQQQEEEEEEEEQEEEEEEQRTLRVQRFRAKLSPGDVVVIPASYPVAVNASSDLNLLAFGINGENNDRNFLAGENDNVIRQIHRPVKEVAFPGSAQDVERLIKKQRQSHFADAQPQQREEGRKERRGPLSSILGAFY